MNIFQLLENAKTEIEFFAAICKLTKRTVVGVWGEILTPSHPEHGSGLSVRLTQSLIDILPDGRKRGYSKQTHTFTIYGDNTLIWQITDGETLVGLAAIQEGLQRLSSVLNSQLLTPQTTKQPKQDIPIYQALGYETQEEYEIALEESIREHPEDE